MRQLGGRGRGHGGVALASNRLLALHRRAAQFIIASRANPAASQYINKRGHAALYIHVSTGSSSFSLTHSLSLSFCTLAVARLDKEFVGPFGLMLPDVTQLPATFDVLLANLQVSRTRPLAEVANEEWRTKWEWAWEWGSASFSNILYILYKDNIGIFWPYARCAAPCVCPVALLFLLLLASSGGLRFSLPLCSAKKKGGT